MHKAERGVATGHISGNNPQRTNVKHLIKRERFAAHFFNNAVDVFRPAIHQRRYAAVV